VYGLQEAAVVEDCVRHLVERCNLQPGQLGVITPYAAQVALLSKRLQKQGYNINGSGSSGSWDSQGGEWVECQHARLLQGF
jgi:superfamily I DNA and/or RNA helicase